MDWTSTFTPTSSASTSNSFPPAESNPDVEMSDAGDLSVPDVSMEDLSAPSESVTRPLLGLEKRDPERAVSQLDSGQGEGALSLHLNRDERMSNMPSGGDKDWGVKGKRKGKGKRGRDNQEEGDESEQVGPMKVRSFNESENKGDEI
jgi:hypothetical protein